ncbi:putative K domain-containing protein [Helianthus annuus]|uniref:K domain-containing protein n=1 Tax=Helianthus annuus TaxID=4232 RepID=A0A9K3HJX9_HELAN|nr:RNA-binding KH domain-containing protein RCF3 isoform X1 [Helianthus annuus]XP_021998631.1 RNA-binding KH domain-containing protein RCF3 isoform X1 [Helianthus annuus]XP_021998632.1 RNA-binding KH domain-containing protein RCF3 isoform X1 [Helianthus annuus]XP_021998633.1 RNA-binding KH domain-containing protein RCF3 isoform X1 [Helianthus annuus]KAF5779560.1 putative K domain-containing protein [Helianthus annuus]KAJ0490827.1 putative K domain-containing protein [Helianthus annuus]KAJ0495
MADQNIDYGKRYSHQPDYPAEAKESHGIGPQDTVYRYLCPSRKIGSIIGRGGEIVKQLRSETNAKIRISENVPGCEERVVIIYSSSEQTNSCGDTDDLVSPAQDALFKVHDRVIAEEAPGDEFDDVQQVVVRMLVPSDQIGCVIGKGGQVVQTIRNETHAQIRILSSDYLPNCALSSDELLQISGDPTVVRNALYQLASRLHDNPSRSQHLLLSSSSLHRASGGYMGPNPGPFSLMGPYAGYRNDSGDGVREFSLRFVCPAENIGAVIGKGGAIIKQIRQESGAFVTVHSSAAEGDDCLITVSAKELFEDASPTIDAAMRLQPRCSEKFEKDSGVLILTTRFLVPSSRIGCLIGKGGSIISEMRNLTRANIRILNIENENLPKVASEDEQMVQITGEINVASNALLQVTTRLRANVFEMDMPDMSRHDNRDGNFRGSGSHVVS